MVLTIHEIGESLYGSRWQSELARALGVSGRHMRRIVAGEANITPAMRAAVLDLAKARREAIEKLIKRVKS